MLNGRELVNIIASNTHHEIIINMDLLFRDVSSVLRFKSNNLQKTVLEEKSFSDYNDKKEIFRDVVGSMFYMKK